MANTLDARFKIGTLVATPGAIHAIGQAKQHAMEFISLHRCGNWGDIDAEDRQANELALQYGERILSVYHTARGVKIWIITEADRSSTCILLPEDY